MELRPGYKQTEVGVTPRDWEVISIRDVALVEGGYAFSSKKFFSIGKYQVIKMSNLYGNNLNLDRGMSFLNQIDNLEEHYLLKENDILITLTGTVGKKDYGYTYRIRNKKILCLINELQELFLIKM
jgi:type I restriction enzyme, S subunit